MEVKKPYVQMPKPDNDEAVRLLAEMVAAAEEQHIEWPLSEAYDKAKEYLKTKGIVSEVEV